MTNVNEIEDVDVKFVVESEDLTGFQEVQEGETKWVQFGGGR